MVCSFNLAYSIVILFRTSCLRTVVERYPWKGDYSLVREPRCEAWLFLSMALSVSLSVSLSVALVVALVIAMGCLWLRL